MRRILAVLILGVVVALTAARAFAGGERDASPFFGDGFDNTTCADMPRCR
jgi:hypothetical protein